MSRSLWRRPSVLARFLRLRVKRRALWASSVVPIVTRGLKVTGKLSLWLIWMGVVSFALSAAFWWVRLARYDAFLLVLFLAVGSIGTAISVRAKHGRGVYWLIRSYAFATLLFACIYYVLYLADARSFSFSDSFSRQAFAERSQKLYSEQTQSYRRLAGFRAVQFFVYAAEDSVILALLQHRTEDSWEIPPRYLLDHTAYYAPKGIPQFSFLLRYGNSKVVEYTGTGTGSRLGVILQNLAEEAKDRDSYLEALDNLQDWERERLNTSIRELEGDEPERRFGIVDFTYFSFVTVTTLGHGDIVPNSTGVRLVVMLQILFGVSLLLRVDRVRQTGVEQATDHRSIE